MSEGVDLDELDFRIISALQNDGRKSTTKIADELGVPRTTIARRLERLIDEKVITIGAYANGAKIGLPIQVMIEIWTSVQHHDEVIAALTVLDEIRWLGIASGPYDILAEAMVHSNLHLRHLLLRRIGKIQGISRIRTAHILEVRKIAFDWEAMLASGEEAERIESQETALSSGTLHS